VTRTKIGKCLDSVSVSTIPCQSATRVFRGLKAKYGLYVLLNKEADRTLYTFTLRSTDFQK